MSDLNYLEAEDWTHIFPGQGEKRVRFLFSLATHIIGQMEVLTPTGWRPSTRIEREEVADSLLNANRDAIDHPDDYGLVVVGLIPPWALRLQGMKPVAVGHDDGKPVIQWHRDGDVAAGEPRCIMSFTYHASNEERDHVFASFTS